MKGTMLVVRAVSKTMAEQEPRTHHSARHGTTRSLGRGSIVTLSSANGFVPAPGTLPYTASKHAVIGITKAAGTSNSALSSENNDWNKETIFANRIGVNQLSTTSDIRSA
jgi:NAD(P)-dependent dehydrogenase (short-subunit alcohol dehydrogenase family)